MKITHNNALSLIHPNIHRFKRHKGRLCLYVIYTKKKVIFVGHSKNIYTRLRKWLYFKGFPFPTHFQVLHYREEENVFIIKREIINEYKPVLNNYLIRTPPPIDISQRRIV